MSQGNSSTSIEKTPHIETVEDGVRPNWKLSKSGDGDTALALFDNPNDLHEHTDPQEMRKLLWRIDLMIIPCLAVCYAFFYIDKTTLSYAAIFGIIEDLELTGTEYSWLSSIFYVGFLIWAVPTNLLLQRFPIGKYLGVNIFLWGFFLMLQAACTSFKTLAVLRALAGAAESCADPAFMMVTSMWYTRKEQPIRLGLWYTANGFGIALGGLLGYGIGNIKGALPSWKYEFIIIGALCCTWGIVIFLIMPDSPVTAPLLSAKHRRMAVERLCENQTGVENKSFKLYQAKEAFCDYKAYLYFLIGIVFTVPNGGISNFGTIIIKGFGFSTLGTTLIQVPYGVLIAILILACIFLNDRFANCRCLFANLFLTINIAGAFGLRFIAQDQKAARLVSYYLTAGYNASFVLVMSVIIGNTAGHTKKVVCNAFLFVGYCIGHVSGPFFYLAEQKPTYSLGIWSMIVAHLCQAVIIGSFGILLARENKRRDRIQSSQPGGLEGRDLSSTAFSDMTDKENLNFRYIY